jgi:hypothetical protein
VNGSAARPFNTHMKYLAACVVLCAGSATAAPQPQPQQIPQRELRQVLQQYHPDTKPAAPRQLTPVERAELRRQLDEYRAPRRR